VIGTGAALGLGLSSAPGPVSAGDWPQWCGSATKNMVSTETGLPA
jgi:hypothetical protein